MLCLFKKVNVLIVIFLTKGRDCCFLFCFLCLFGCVKSDLSYAAGAGVVPNEVSSVVSVCACIPQVCLDEWNSYCDKQLHQPFLSRFGRYSLRRKKTMPVAPLSSQVLQPTLKTVSSRAQQQETARDTMHGLYTYFRQDAAKIGYVHDWKDLLTHNKRAWDQLKVAINRQAKMACTQKTLCAQWEHLFTRATQQYGANLYFPFFVHHYTSSLQNRLTALMAENPMGQAYDFAQYQKMKAYIEEVALFKKDETFKQFACAKVQAMTGSNRFEKMLNCVLNVIKPYQCDEVAARHAFENTPLSKERLVSEVSLFAGRYLNLNALKALYNVRVASFLRH